jgi:DNA-binding transcriptional LysR family regulator
MDCSWEDRVRIVLICVHRYNPPDRKNGLRFPQNTMIGALATFLAVAEHGNFSRVARDQNVAVSSVMRKIDLLEAEMGAKLFNRGTRQMQLTDAGEKLMPRARNMLAELAEARDAIASVEAEPRGVLTVTAPASFGRRHVAPAVASFLLRHPLLEVDLHLGDEILDLSAEHVDAAVRIGVLPGSDLLATTLAPQRRVACASPAYLKRAGRPKTPEDLLKHNCLTVRSPAPRVGWWQFAEAHRGRPLPVRGSFRSDDSDALMQAALCGVGVAHLATWLVSDEIATGRLVALFPQELSAPPAGGSAIHVVRQQGRAVAKSQRFIAHLQACFGVEVGGKGPVWDWPARRDSNPRPAA